MTDANAQLKDVLCPLRSTEKLAISIPFETNSCISVSPSFPSSRATLPLDSARSFSPFRPGMPSKREKYKHLNGRLRNQMAILKKIQEELKALQEEGTTEETAWEKKEKQVRKMRELSIPKAPVAHSKEGKNEQSVEKTKNDSGYWSQERKPMLPIKKTKKIRGILEEMAKKNQEVAGYCEEDSIEAGQRAKNKDTLSPSSRDHESNSPHKRDQSSDKMPKIAQVALNEEEIRKLTQKFLKLEIKLEENDKKRLKNKRPRDPEGMIGVRGNEERQSTIDLGDSQFIKGNNLNGFYSNRESDLDWKKPEMTQEDEKKKKLKGNGKKPKETERTSKAKKEEDKPTGQGARSEEKKESKSLSKSPISVTKVNANSAGFDGGSSQVRKNSKEIKGRCDLTQGRPHKVTKREANSTNLVKKEEKSKNPEKIHLKEADENLKPKGNPKFLKKATSPREKWQRNGMNQKEKSQKKQKDSQENKKAIMNTERNTKKPQDLLNKEGTTKKTLYSSVPPGSHWDNHQLQMQATPKKKKTEHLLPKEHQNLVNFKTFQPLRSGQSASSQPSPDPKDILGNLLAPHLFESPKRPNELTDLPSQNRTALNETPPMVLSGAHQPDSFGSPWHTRSDQAISEWTFAAKDPTTNPFDPNESQKDHHSLVADFTFGFSEPKSPESESKSILNKPILDFLDETKELSVALFKKRKETKEVETQTEISVAESHLIDAKGTTDPKLVISLCYLSFLPHSLKSKAGHHGQEIHSSFAQNHQLRLL